MPPSDATTTGSSARLSAAGPEKGGPRPDVPGERLAAAFKRAAAASRPGYTMPPLSRTSAVSLYRRHKAAFDDVAEFFGSRGLSAEGYAGFFVGELGKTEDDLDGMFYSRWAIGKYADRLAAAEKRRKVYGWYEKSVKNVAAIAAERGFMSGRDCVMALAREGRLAALLAAGVVSKYFLAAIPNFRDLAPTLDHFSKCELAELLDRYDMYNTEVNEAVLRCRNRVANPLAAVDAELAAARDRRRDGLFFEDPGPPRAEPRK